MQLRSRSQVRSANRAERSAAASIDNFAPASADAGGIASVAAMASPRMTLREATDGHLCDVALACLEDHRAFLDEVADDDGAPFHLEQGRAVAAVGDQPDRAADGGRAVAADRLVVALAAAPKPAATRALVGQLPFVPHPVAPFL